MAFNPHALPVLLMLGCVPGCAAADKPATAPSGEPGMVHACAADSYTSTTATAPGRERDGRWDHANGVRLDLFARPRDLGVTRVVTVVGQRSDDGPADDHGYQGMSGRVGLGVAVVPAERVAVQVMPFAGYGTTAPDEVGRARDGEPGSLEFGLDLNASYRIGGFELGGGIGYACGEGDYPFSIPVADAGGSADRTGPVYSIFVGTRH